MEIHINILYVLLLIYFLMSFILFKKFININVKLINQYLKHNIILKCNVR